MISRRRILAIAALALGFGVGVVVVVTTGNHNVHRGAYATLALAAGWGFTGTGLYAWRRRPRNRVGPLMIAVGFSGMLKALAFSNDSALFTIASLGEVVIFSVLVQLLLSFPSGRLDGRIDRLVVAASYINTTAIHLAAFLFTDPVRSGCANCPRNPLLIDAPRVGRVMGAAEVDIAIGLLGAVVAVLYRRWRSSTPAQRRAYAPVFAGGGLTFALLMTQLLVEQAGLGTSVSDALTLALFGSIALLPAAFLIGLMRFRFGQAEAVSALVARLGGGEGGGAVRDALAAALEDRDVGLAYWVPDQQAYVDAAGRPMRIDPPPEGKLATIVQREGRRIGAIVHDAALAEEREHVQAVGAAAALTLENERLDAELRANLDELRASRARIVAAGDVQRRRIERNLHDGAQQRLMALGINLRMAREAVRETPEEAIELLDASLDELDEATRDLRELARGIHPAVLTDRGLAAALNGLADRSPVPVDVTETPAERLPSAVESAVYFVVAEALTNVARYAQAHAASVSVQRNNGHVDVAVSDDGIGGADPEQGSGLRGLSDRVAALDGRLELTSAIGHGTTVKATIPCE